MSLLQIEKVGTTSTGTYMRPLPLISIEAQEKSRENYEAVVRERLGGSDDEELHLTVAQTNLQHRFNHINQGVANSEDARHDFTRLSWTDHDTPERVSAYLSSSRFPSLEVSTYVEAGNQARTARTDFDDVDTSALINAGLDVDHEAPRLRAKVTRLIGKRAAVVTTKLDGLTASGPQGSAELKIRESGFVRLDDDDLTESELLALRSLGGMAWSVELEDIPRAKDAIDYQRQSLLSALSRKAIFNPTVSILYAVRKE